MMPIRFPTEAANDPDGKLPGPPEATGEDDIDALRGRASDARKPRPEREARDGDSPKGKDDER